MTVVINCEYLVTLYLNLAILVKNKYGRKWESSKVNRILLIQFKI